MPVARNHSCNTVRVGARREDAPDSSSASNDLLGAPPTGYGVLEPVSPELALVDHVLAERARMLLPEPHEQPRPARHVAEAPRARVSPPRRPETAPAVRKQNRWRRTVALALLIFAAGAASGGLLGKGPDLSSPSPLHARPTLLTVPVATGTEHSTPATRANRAKSGEPRTIRATAWAANVLGLRVGIDRKGVRLVWERPTESNYVVVVRKLISERHSVVVFRGPAASFQDVSARPCTSYRYLIINYDRRGHPSTGVRTSVVTQGCGPRASRRPSA